MDGFSLRFVDVGSAVLRVRSAGSGPKILLLHGHPRTHTTWWRVAPLLVERGFSVVCPDLPGYGESRQREPDPSKRAMAAQLDALMDGAEYAVVGHDRGALVAFRMGLSGYAARLIVLDGLPVSEHLSRCDARFAASWWHWFFFAQREKPADAIISRDPLSWYRVDPEQMGPENYADWRRAVTNPEVVSAMVAEYRAGIEVDRHHEEADFAAGMRVECPTLVGWSEHDDLEDLYGDPLAIWRSWVTGPLSGVKIASGHHMAEEAPEELATAIAGFVG
jgi:haloacetate dehalogenase